MSDNKQTEKKLRRSIIVAVILAMCLCVTTFALVLANVSVDGNFFHTGIVKINLNDGKPIINEHEFLFEPGMTVEKKFFVENRSTSDVFYKVYFSNIEGGLADVLEIKITDGNNVLFSGKASELTRANVGAAEEILRENERRDLIIQFHYPEEAMNDTQKLTFSFDLSADAVQTKNNSEREFD